MQDLNWDDLRFLLAAARHRSFAGAARQLSVNETTVARRVANAESGLGARLFERNPGGALHLTDAGQQALAGAERVEQTLLSLTQAIGGADTLVAGTVRLTSVPILTNRVLPPLLPALLQRYPQLRLELIAEPRDLSLTKRETDIALRLARPVKELRAVARRIGQLEYAVYTPRKPRRRPLPWLTYSDAMIDLPQSQWLAQRLSRGREVAAAVAVNDAETLLQSIKAGLGKSLLPTIIGDNDTALTRDRAEPVALSRELWLLVHPDLKNLARVRAVLDWLGGVFGAISVAGTAAQP